MAEPSEIDTRPAGNQKRDNVASAGLPPDTWNRLEAYRERRGITARSDAVARLIDKGLNVEENESDETSFKDRLLGTVGVIFMSGYPALATYYGNPDSAVILVAMFAIFSLFGPQLEQLYKRVATSLKSAFSWLTDRTNYR